LQRFCGAGDGVVVLPLEAQLTRRIGPPSTGLEALRESSADRAKSAKLAGRAAALVPLEPLGKMGIEGGVIIGKVGHAAC
jgi:hypothetical protein